MIFFLSLVSICVLGLVLFIHYRHGVMNRLPERFRAFLPSNSQYRPLPTFVDQLNAGLSSSNFDIESNIRDGDSRAGLDERGTQEVMDIMRTDRVTFDQARLIRHNRILAQNQIDPSGMPMDKKAITHL